jgi:hypothetical protein
MTAFPDISEVEKQFRSQTREKLLQLIHDSADKVNKTNADHVRSLAEAYALVVGTTKS